MGKRLERLRPRKAAPSLYRVGALLTAAERKMLQAVMTREGATASELFRRWLRAAFEEER